MKTSTNLLMCLMISTQVWAQGSLTPPDVPSATMRTLTQIEPRIPVQSLADAPPYNITQPGSYYLTGNITVTNGNAISITASDVSLDLMGFTLESTKLSPVDGAAIKASTVSRLKICNGNIKSGSTVTSGTLAPNGFIYGIVGDNISFGTFSDIQVIGVALQGLWGDDNCLIERCKVSNSYNGIKNAGSSITKDCMVANCASNGIEGSIVEGCTAYGFYGTGISAALASHSSGGSQVGIGMRVTSNAQNCSGGTSWGTGLDCSGGTASGCSATVMNGSYSLKADIAIGCKIYNGISGSASITNRYNMP